MATKPASFVTFGMFIVDEIEWLPPSTKERKTNLIGGAGTYAVLGAKLASSPCQIISKNISWIVDVGSDFPSVIRNNIDEWNTDCNYRVDDTRLTTRAWNGYGENELRSFKYITPKKRLEVQDLSSRQLLSKSFHMSSREKINLPAQMPVIVWEPIPDLCLPDQLATLQSAMQGCTIVSPNHEELKTFFNADVANNEEPALLVKRLMGWKQTHESPSTLTTPIVREGANGSTAYFHHRHTDTISSVHLPAYHTSEMQSLVIDPTGGGNTYLGALAIAMTDALQSQPTYALIKKNIGTASTVATAMIYATVAASFVIEQHGVPNLDRTKVFTEIFEYWNGQSFIDRLKVYLQRESEAIKRQLSLIPG
ncbi:Double-stranded RNA-containing particles stability [Lithohypha guttulata]|uniref:Double-stranded RNA-containing particles stability n=1 Tax=Lithohypha guttulata TaxID=1690604 RepID=UPI002DE064C2|nr:Double-stranded RNA-containing particles stability [Lithohypha guttulata]